ncbi:gp062 [Rhodococcus phage ReqiPepy6]|uniref:Gp062 n=1 Tax=Rhodococcus phage ReqiPepy6 TaxID=691965 RepID=D4P7H3_9CAUD|nr:gp062 [Rhodococcus phage ReqiPepy6]ADD80953.1 gp062 [Rhodococcus phage ReqiPepy6]
MSDQNENVVIEEDAIVVRFPRFKKILRKIEDNSALIAAVTATVVTSVGIIALKRLDEKTVETTEVVETTVIDVTPTED